MNKKEAECLRFKNFKYLMEEIKPFIKPKKYIKYSTAGVWRLTEEWMR